MMREGSMQTTRASCVLGEQFADAELERRVARRLLDVLIRAALLLALALLCYRAVAPFLSLAIWAVIFAVTLYPLQLRIAARFGGRPGLAATANLFVPFFTTKPHGSGIGLVLVRQIADAHGAAFTLQNRRDRRGCVATLTLAAK